MRSRVKRYQMPIATKIIGTTSQGMGPDSGVLPKSFTLCGTP